MKKENTSKELTFEEFSKKLNKMNESCGSCKYLKYQEANSLCTKHNTEMTNKSPRCDDWRYFA
jgi:hypothetical protein